jgi:UDP:flavonoid glycosyltransferase YjiC (YdhE family)
VLDEPRHRKGAQRLAALLAAAPGPSEAARLLEGLAPPRRAGAAVAVDGGTA